MKLEDLGKQTANLDKKAAKIKQKAIEVVTFSSYEDLNNEFKEKTFETETQTAITAVATMTEQKNLKHSKHYG